MLILRRYTLDEVDKIRILLYKEGIKDFALDGIVYIVKDNEDLVGVGKAKLINNKWELNYLVISEDKRNQKLGDALLRALLNNLYNQGIDVIYSKLNNSYLLKKGFIINTNNELELNIPDFFSKGCNSCGGCNELR